MKTAPTKPAPPASTRNWRKILLITLSFTVLAAIGAWFALLQQAKAAQERAYQADKAKFAQVEAEMSKIQQVVISTNGQPEHDATDKACNHVSAKLDNGTLYCTTSIHWLYAVGNAIEAGEKLGNLENSITSLLNVNVDKLSNDNGRFEASTEVYQNNVIQYRKNKGVDCEIRYAYYSGDSGEMVLRKDEQKFLSINYLCSSEVIKPVYPLAE